MLSSEAWFSVKTRFNKFWWYKFVLSTSLMKKWHECANKMTEKNRDLINEIFTECLCPNFKVVWTHFAKHCGGGGGLEKKIGHCNMKMGSLRVYDGKIMKLLIFIAIMQTFWLKKRRKKKKKKKKKKSQFFLLKSMWQGQFLAKQNMCFHFLFVIF